ncbi:MAG: tyrosine-type recombinase/integrase [Alphaproteobacteria bacterium]
MAVNTFKAVAEEWHAKNLHTWSAEHGAKILRRLEKHVFADLGKRPIEEIKPFDLLTVLQKIEKRDDTEILRRVVQTCAAIFRYGIVTGRCEINPAAHLRGAFKPHRAKHYPTLHARELPSFLQALADVKTSELNRLALQLLMLTFVRTGEMRKAKWEDIHLDRALWVLPAANMKMRVEHHVPLSAASISVLKQIKAIAGDNPFGLLLPSQNRQKNPMMCENTINNLIDKMGYKGKLVGHGFRALASTTLNEAGKFKPDVIERQLAHKEPNATRAAYNHAEYWDERVVMMNWWADYLDALRVGGTVVIQAKFKVG